MKSGIPEIANRSVTNPALCSFFTTISTTLYEDNIRKTEKIGDDLDEHE